MNVRLICVAAAFGLAVAAARADDSAVLPEVQEIRLGFANHYKLGGWTPVEITLRGAPGDSGAAGRLDVQTLDGDAVPAWIVPGPNTNWTAGQTYTAYTRIGRSDGPIHVRLTRLDGGGEHLPKLLPGMSGASGATAIPATNEFIVELGESLGLTEMFRRQDQRDIDRTTVVTLTQPQQLPDQWFGYEGVDLVAIAGQSAIEKSFFSTSAVDALEHWVRLGGHLLIVCGEDANRVLGSGGPLGRFAPGQLGDMVSLPPTLFGPIESYANSDSDERLSGDHRLRIPQWKNVKGNVELFARAQVNDLPLIVRYPLGFGQVTVVALDLDKPPFSEWRGGRSKFLERLLDRRGLAAPLSIATQGAAQAKRFGFVDLSGQLRGALDQFDRVQLVPFWLVAALALLYLALLFPLNYWLVTRWWKRQQAGWIVFFATCFMFAGGAIALASYTKGTGRHVNQADLVDVDLEAGQARGTTWFNLYSSKNELDDLSLSLSLIAGSPTPSLPGAVSGTQTSAKLLSWFGLSGTGLGGMNSKVMNAPLFDESYVMNLQTGVISGVPLAVWSSKSFVARWETSAGGIVADLHGTSNHRLLGEIVNRLNMRLEDCALLYNNWVYLFNTLAPGESVQIERYDPIAVNTYLTKQHARSNTSEEITPYDRAGFDVARIVELMMFHAAAGGESYAGLLHRYQRFTDLSDQLKYDRAILVCRGPQGAMIELGGQPLSDAELDHHTTIYRYLLSVKPRD